MKKYNNTGNAGVHKNRNRSACISNGNRSGHASEIRAGNGSANLVPLHTAI